jgi:hypothetical protein
MHPTTDFLLVAVMALPLADLVLMAMVRTGVIRRSWSDGDEAQGGGGKRGGCEQLEKSHVRLVLPDVTTEAVEADPPIAMLSRCCGVFPD